MEYISSSRSADGNSRANADVPQTVNTAAKSLPAVAQLYKSKANVTLGTSVQSTNGAYFLGAQSGNNKVYAANGQTAPLHSSVTNANVDGNGTSEYEPQSKFLADCLHTAEEIMHGHNLRQGNVNSKETTTSNSFGDTEQGNWNTATSVGGDHKDKKASPSLGQSYAIVEQQPLDLGGGVICQYHAAAVVAVDGTDNITLEVFGSPNSGKRTATGRYAIYSSSPRTQQTFHTIWAGTFPNGVTISLEKV